MDLISRQAAIERLREYVNDDMTSTEKAIGADYCVDMIRTMPSAQPEIIRCKDCGYYDPSEIDGESDWCHVWGETTEGNAFCSYAKRKGDQT